MKCVKYQCVGLLLAAVCALPGVCPDAAAAGVGRCAVGATRTGDFDGDCDIDFWDFMDFIEVYGLSDGDPGWVPDGPSGDFDGDEDVDFWDFMAFIDDYGTSWCGPGFVEVAGTQMTLNGEAFRFVGANNYYLMQRSVEGQGFRSQADEVLDDAAALGISVMRTWGFNHGLYNWDDPDYAAYAHQPSAIRGTPEEPVLNWNPLLMEPAAYEDTGAGLVEAAPAVVNEEVFRALDYIVREAGNRGIRLVLPLINGGNLTSTNYEYGGRGLFVAWSQNPEYYFGSGAVPAEAADEFYTHPVTRQWYRDYVDMMVERVNVYTGVAYKDDPAILGWELGNELLVAPANKDDLAVWISEMAGYIHGKDPNHLVSVGVEGLPLANEPNGTSGFENRVGISFSEAHASPYVDFTTGHLWRDGWGFGSESYWTAILQWQIDQSAALDKPYCFEEFNLSISGGAERREQWWGAYFAVMEANTATACGDLFWHLAHDLYPDYDTYTMYYPADEAMWQLLSEHRGRFLPGGGGNVTQKSQANARAPDTGTRK